MRRNTCYLYPNPLYMKPISVFFAFLFIFQAYSQKNKSQPAADAFEQQRKVYQMALQFADYAAARGALYQMMVLRPEMESLKDSLALVFYSEGAYVQAVAIAREILKKNPADTVMLEVAAHGEEGLGLLKESLANFEKLNARIPTLYFSYKTAMLQYRLKRLGECAETVSTILADEKATQQIVTINYDNNTKQSVSIAAAALNIAGLISMEMGNNKDARTLFEQSLQLQKDFALPLTNLQILEKIEKQGSASE